MVTYEDMKSRLKAESLKDNKYHKANYTKYFTREFYNTYLNERKQSFDNYCKTGIWSELSEVVKSDFYNKNGYAWCRMLEFLYASFKCFKVRFFDKDNQPLRTINYMCDDIKEAELWAKAYLPNCFYQITLL